MSERWWCLPPLRFVAGLDIPKYVDATIVKGKESHGCYPQLRRLAVSRFFAFSYLLVLPLSTILVDKWIFLVAFPSKGK